MWKIDLKWHGWKEGDQLTLKFHANLEEGFELPLAVELRSMSVSCRLSIVGRLLWIEYYCYVYYLLLLLLLINISTATITTGIAAATTGEE